MTPDKFSQKYKVAVLLVTSHASDRGMIRGILKYVRSHTPWELFLFPSGLRDLYVPNMKQWEGTGIIGNVRTHKLFTDVVQCKCPAVIVNPTDRVLKQSQKLHPFCSMTCDSEKIGKMAANFFLEKKFEHFAFVGENSNINWSRDRSQFYIERLKSFNKQCHVYSPRTTLHNWGVEYKEMEKWLKKLPKPIGIFVAMDARGRQVLEACRNAGILVPYQVAVLGVDDDELICESASPPMSSILMDTEEAGYRSAELLDLLMRREIPPQNHLTYSPLKVVPRRTTEIIHIDDKLVVKTLDLINTYSGFAIRISDIVHQMKVSRRYLELRFKEKLGYTIHEEIIRARLEKIQSLLSETTLPYREIAIMAGFDSFGHFCRIFKERIGMTLKEFREQSKNNVDKD